MASVAVDVADMTDHRVRANGETPMALEAVMAAAASSSTASTPCNSAVFSTASTSALTSLSSLSRQNSDLSQLHDDVGESSTNGRVRASIHRVASEQLLPVTPSVTPTTVRASSMVVGKVTSRRRQRNPRRFVVTELPPEQDDFLSESSPPKDVERQLSGHSATSDAASSATPTAADGAVSPAGAPARTPRPAKMEVRGRFTIIDLSPDSPETSSQPEDAQSAMDQVELSRSARSSGAAATTSHSSTSVRRRQLPRRFSRSEKATNASTPTAASASASRAMPESSVLTAAMLQDAQTSRYSSQDDNSYHNGNSFVQAPQQSPLRVDLSALDRHLVFLQQESHDMKALLESMISSNARWITALASSPDSNIGSGKNPKAVHPAASPGMQSHATPVAVPSPEPTLEQKYEKLQQAHSDLQAKYDALLRESSQLQRNNIMLETRLRQETSVNEELRIHVDQLTQYTESLILSAEAPVTDEPQRRGESLSSSSTDVLADHEAAELLVPPAPSSLTRRSKPTTPVLQPHLPPQYHQRSISDFSVDSAALWMMDNNQSGLEDDDESNVDDSDDLDATTPRGLALAKLRRRRWRNMSRSASMSMEDDSASSVYSSGYRDSWVSMHDPQHVSVDGASEDVSGDDGNPLFELPKSRKIRMDSSDSSLLLVEPASNNQTEDDATDADNDAQLPTFWSQRRKSAAMIVEELEHEVAPPSSATNE